MKAILGMPGTVGSGAVDLISRLLAIEVSALCDADKSMPVLDPAIRAMVPDVRFAGPALTVVAADDHLPVFSALDAASAGDVLVIKGERLAVLGELFATEAARRGLAGVVIDGYCRDVAGLRRVGLPVFARGTTPASGSTVSRAALGQPVVVGGLSVRSGDIVFGDDDGVVVAPASVVSAALEGAEAIGRAERAILSSGGSLHDQTNWAEHVAALDRGESSSLAFQPHE
jgi:4-hydroxy-4-methyl-2-oxoglutarate aldolase